MDEPRPRKIVLVEDDESTRVTLERMLSSGGYEVAATSDPTKAVELVRSADPDLVLSDITMPVMDGYAVLKALQSDPATARYPVVFLTGHQEFSERVRAFRYGVVDYLTKPVPRDVLLRKVERILEGRARRVGVVATGPEIPAKALLEEVQREARSGVLTVKGPEGDSRVVIRAGEVVESTADIPEDPTASAEFAELDAAHEDILAHDPPRLPGRREALPDFESVPEVLRDVLVVDDNPVFRRFLRQLLTSRGFTVHEAVDGEEGLRLALERRPWLILTDVRMPSGDGFEFCRRVRSHSLIRQTPLLFLSGWDDYKQRYRGLELGADDFLSKETSIRELLIRIQLLMKRYADLGATSRKETGMEGDIPVIGAPGVLQVCHLTRLSGVLSAQNGNRLASVRFRAGEIIGAECGSFSGEDAIHEFLAWEEGRFRFDPSDPGEGRSLGESFDQLILEGCRRLDERRRGG